MDIISFPLTPSGPEWRAHRSIWKVICIPRATRSQLNKWRRSPWPLFPPGPKPWSRDDFHPFLSHFLFSSLSHQIPAFEQVSTTAQTSSGGSILGLLSSPSIYPSLDERLRDCLSFKIRGGMIKWWYACVCGRTGQGVGVGFWFSLHKLH